MQRAIEHSSRKHNCECHKGEERLTDFLSSHSQVLFCLSLFKHYFTILNSRYNISAFEQFPLAIQDRGLGNSASPLSRPSTFSPPTYPSFRHANRLHWTESSHTLTQSTISTPRPGYHTPKAHWRSIQPLCDLNSTEYPLYLLFTRPGF